VGLTRAAQAGIWKKLEMVFIIASSAQNHFSPQLPSSDTVGGQALTGSVKLQKNY